MAVPSHLTGISRPSPTDADLRLAELRAPRYTSYPTALEFHERIGPDDLLAEIQRTNQEPLPAPLSLYLHLPFCASACFYCGCHRVVSRNRKQRAEYLTLLQAEIRLLAGVYAPDRMVEQIHLGGGTPNLFRPDQLESLLAELRGAYPVSPDCEISMEIDPRQYQDGDAAAWAALGINRLSLGVQDVDPDVQQGINRRQPIELVKAVVRAVRAAGIRNLNFDLIYGLPGQTAEGVEANVDLIARLRPNRVAIFHYAHLPARFRAQRAMDASALPDTASRLAMQSRYQKSLQALGYEHIGLDHFALPEDPLARALAGDTLHRNFQGYTTRGDCDIQAFGVSAISNVGRLYAQNHSDMAAWHQAIENGTPAIRRGYCCSDDDLERAAIIQQLMCRARVDFTSLMPAAVFRRKFATELARLHALDPAGHYLRIAPDHLDILPAGRHLLRVLAQCFDAHSSDRRAGQLAQAG